MAKVEYRVHDDPAHLGHINDSRAKYVAIEINRLPRVRYREERRDAARALWGAIVGVRAMRCCCHGIDTKSSYNARA